MLFRRKYRRKKKFLRRFAKIIFTVVVCSALVLGVSYATLFMADLEVSTFAKVSSFLLSYVGVDEDVVGDIAGEFAKRMSETDISPLAIPDGSAPTDSDGELVVSLAIMSDCENDFENLEKALSIAKQKGISTVIFLGDFTQWGDLESLKEAKVVLDASGLKYYSLPGDHDLANSVQEGDSTGLKNFESVFGKNHHTLLIGGVRLVMTDNSANLTPVDLGLQTWFEKEVETASFVFFSQPLYHPTNTRVMGVLNDGEVAVVREQALGLLETIRKSDVKAIIAADQHVSSSNTDPIRDSLEHLVVGALVDNDVELRNPQSSRFAILHLFEGGGYELEDVLL